MTSARYDYDQLRKFATGLGTKIGLPAARADKQAEILLEADLMGHTTHGLVQLSGILKNLETGVVRATGEPTVITDRGASLFWDADRLPGTWLLSCAIAEARGRAAKHGSVVVAIKRIANIAALGAYLRQATDYGLAIIIMNSDPSMRTVTPAGGIEGAFSPNPLAFGYPTEEEPVLIDISTASVANAWVRRWSAEKKKLPGKWLQDVAGNVTDDPSVLFGNQPGTMLPLGGLELGHKGFAMGLIVEALTAALTGLGRADKVAAGTGTPVFLQVIDPAAFGGTGAFKREASWLANACRAVKPRTGQSAVRMPGDTASRARQEQLRAGITLYPSIMPDLEGWAEKLGVTPPQPRG
jgi:L-lactate dehydrogenase